MKPIIYLLMILLLAGTVSAICYQESANTTNQTGKDNCVLNYNGNYSSFGVPFYRGFGNDGISISPSSFETAAVGVTAPIYITYYRIPYAILSLSNWSVWFNETRVNVNISLQNCSSFNNNVSLKIMMNRIDVLSGYIEYWCLNRTRNDLLIYNTSASNDVIAFWEEAMVWDTIGNLSNYTVINNSPTNVGRTTNVSINFSNPGYFSDVNVTLVLNNQLYGASTKLLNEDGYYFRYLFAAPLIPGNYSLFFNTSAYNVTGSVNVTLINGTYLEVINNMTMYVQAFKETSLTTRIQNINVTLLGTGTSYSASNGSTNYVVTFKNFTVDILNVIVSSVDYGNRTVIVPVTYDQLVYNVSAYLPFLNDSKQISFTVQDGAGTNLAGAQLNFSLAIGGIYYQVSQGLTDVSGVSSAWLNPNLNYIGMVSLPGYQTSSFNLIPTESSYTLRISFPVVSGFTLSPGSNYYYTVLPSNPVMSRTSINFSTRIQLKPDSPFTLAGLVVSIPVSAAACRVGVYDGENCTANDTSSSSDLFSYIEVDTRDVNDQLNYHSFVYLSNMEYDDLVRTYRPEIILGVQDNRSIYTGLLEGFAIHDVPLRIRLLIVLVVVVVTGIFLWSVGLPPMLNFVVSMVAMVMFTWFTIGSSNYFVSGVISLAALMLFVFVARGQSG